jgi:hypothetical protein
MKTSTEKAPLLERLLGGSKKDPEKKEESKKPHGAKFKKLKSGGYLVQHHDEHDVPISGDEHAVADIDGLHDHLEEHFGEPNHDEGGVK